MRRTPVIPPQLDSLLSRDGSGILPVDTDKEGSHYRGFKACQNGVEWTIYTLPCLWLNVLYAPALEIMPVVGPIGAIF